MVAGKGFEPLNLYRNGFPITPLARRFLRPVSGLDLESIAFDQTRQPRLFSP